MNREEARVIIMQHTRFVLGMLEPEEQRKLAEDIAFDLMKLGRQSTLPTAREEIVILSKKDHRR